MESRHIEDPIPSTPSLTRAHTKVQLPCHHAADADIIFSPQVTASNVEPSPQLPRTPHPFSLQAYHRLPRHITAIACVNRIWGQRRCLTDSPSTEHCQVFGITPPTAPLRTTSSPRSSFTVIRPTHSQRTLGISKTPNAPPGSKALR